MVVAAELAVGWLDIVRVLTSERVVIGRWGAMRGAARKLKLDLDEEEMIRMPSLVPRARCCCKSAGNVPCSSCIKKYPYIQIFHSASHLGYMPTGVNRTRQTILGI